MKDLYLYPLVFVTALIIDFIWLGLLAKGFYAKELGNLMKDKPNFLSALLVYLVLSLSLVFFITNNSYATNYLSFAILGALFGFTVYTVYDLTNYAVINNYTIKVVIVDILWGTTLGGILGVATKFIQTL